MLRFIDLLRCRRGASVLELALILPVLILLLTGLGDLALMANRKYVLTKSAIRSVELASINGANGSNFDYVKMDASESANVPLDRVTVDHWLECEFKRQVTFDIGCASPNLPSRYVKVTISSEYHALFPGWALSANNSIEASATIRVQ